MNRTFLSFLLLLAALTCNAAANDNEKFVLTSQPTIFWHDGQWQTFQDGQWTPYAAPKKAVAAAEPAEPEAPTAPGPDIVQTNDFIWGLGRGHGFPRAARHRRPVRMDHARLTRENAANSL